MNKMGLKLGVMGVVILVAATAWAANSMETQTYSFTIIADTTPPYVTGQTPEPGAVNVPHDTSIVVYIKDDGTGVDRDSIVMKVNGQTVAPAITGSAAEYVLTYTPATPFPLGQAVSVSIFAKDLAP